MNNNRELLDKFEVEVITDEANAPKRARVVVPDELKDYLGEQFYINLDTEMLQQVNSLEAHRQAFAGQDYSGIFKS